MSISPADSIATPLTRSIGVKYPIFQAGMGVLARPSLVAAVSNAGGLGVLGGLTTSAEEMRKEIQEVRELTDLPFGVDIVLPSAMRDDSARLRAQVEEMIGPEGHKDPRKQYVLDLLAPGRVEAQIAVCIEERVPVFVTGLGTPGPWIDDLHGAGITVMSLCGSMNVARKLADDGVDAVIACGSEGGGHTGRVGSIPLWASCLHELDVPIVAAGGVADGRSIAAALIMGCQGAWMGTRFIATKEAATHENYKNRLVEASPDDCVITKAYSGKTQRVIRNRWLDAWQGTAKEFPIQLLEIDRRDFWAFEDGNVEEGSCPAGQGVGVIDDIPSVNDLIQRLMQDTLASLATSSELLGQTAHA